MVLVDGYRLHCLIKFYPLLKALCMFQALSKVLLVLMVFFLIIYYVVYIWHVCVFVCLVLNLLVWFMCMPVVLRFTSLSCSC